MSTPEQQVPTTAPPAGAAPPPGPPHDEPVHGGPVQGQPSQGQPPQGQPMGGQPMQGQPPPPPGQPSTPGADSGADESLFGDLLSGLRSRWDEVQAGFVDDPKQCVQQADRLVSDVVDRVTAGFEEARTRLEAQWARGEQASTEDLRVALKRYREFFQRLLSMDGSDGAHHAPQPERTETPTA